MMTLVYIIIIIILINNNKYYYYKVITSMLTQVTNQINLTVLQCHDKHVLRHRPSTFAVEGPYVDRVGGKLFQVVKATLVVIGYGDVEVRGAGVDSSVADRVAEQTTIFVCPWNGLERVIID